MSPHLSLTMTDFLRSTLHFLGFLFEKKLGPHRTQLLSQNLQTSVITAWSHMSVLKISGTKMDNKIKWYEINRVRGLQKQII